MSDRHYFINCRGADFLPSYEKTWIKSGGIPLINNLFAGQNQSMNPDTLIFNGSTRTSTWLHFNKRDVINQVKLLRGCGINLLRVHLDLYSWAGLGNEFIERARTLARIAQDNKMYVQWVLFESDTYGDISGVDALGRLHYTGGYDPSTLDQALTYGLLRYQRCPTVYASSFMTRHPSSLDISGNAYLSAVVNALSPYRSTLSWEVMANVDFDTARNPADVSAYRFLTSAISKVKSLTPATKKVTSSFKYVTGDRNSPFYNSTQHAIYSSLDYICYNGAAAGYIDRLINYVDALSAAVTTSSPLMVVNATLASNLCHLHTEVSSFSSLQIGFITDGIIDRNLGAKPLNNDRGILFSNGTARDLKYPTSLKNKAIKDIKNQNRYDYHVRRKKVWDSIINPSFQEIQNYETDAVTNYNKNPFDVSTMTRFSQMGDEGKDMYEYYRKLIYILPELNTYYEGTNSFAPLLTKYAPYSNNEGSKSLGYGLGNASYNIEKNGISNFLTSLLPLFTNTDYALNNSKFTTLNNISPSLGDFARSRFAYFKINLLEKLQRALPVSGLIGYSNGLSYPSMISTANANALSSAYAPFSPSTPYKPNFSSVVPYIENPKYFSGAVYNYLGYLYPDIYESQFIKPFIEPLSACQKPACYYLRGGSFASGACYYKSGSQVSSTVTTIQDVFSMLDWNQYDTVLLNWAYAIFYCWVDVLNGQNTYFTTVSGIIEKAFQNSSFTNNPNPILPNPFNIA